MIKNVDILLCDEPTGSLDDKNAKMVLNYYMQKLRNDLSLL
ncbi:MAG: hypothetical protein ACLRQF_06190 [Thomasclavelia ramosa]